MNKAIFMPRKGNPISRVWIETGDPRQPLACVWIDAETRPDGIPSSKPEVPLLCA